MGYLVNTYVAKPKIPKKENSTTAKKIEGGLFSILDAGVADHDVLLEEGMPAFNPSVLGRSPRARCS